MALDTLEDIRAYLSRVYPNTDNTIIAKELGVTESHVRRLASKHGIRKSELYLELQHRDLMKAKKRKYLASIEDITLSSEERNIIVGSLLGDGRIDPGGSRSINSHYKERFSPAQLGYRLWKVGKLKRLNFRLHRSYQIASPSHPIYTELRRIFYVDNVKTVTRANLKLLSDAIGLACLYLDDGSLVINHSNRRGRTINLNPQIAISSHSFTKKENELLQEHLSVNFGVNFYLKKHPDGQGYHLFMGRIEEIKKLLGLITPYVDSINCMSYKLDLEMRLQEKADALAIKNPDCIIKAVDLRQPPGFYSEEEVIQLLRMRGQGLTISQIAKALNRTSYGITDKIRRLKSEGRLQ